MTTSDVHRRATLAFTTALLLAACGGGERAVPLAVATIDTLPGGAISVISPGPTAWTDTNGWRLVEAGRIRGEPGEGGELITPVSMAVDAAGRVYVSDRSPALIKVFDSAGTLVRTIGREGAGPGEYKSAFIAVKGSLLAVHDPAQSRTSLFDTAGTYLRSWPSGCCYFMAIQFDDQHRIVIPIPGDARSEGVQRYVRYDTLGAPVDTLRLTLPPEGKNWTVRSANSAMSMGIPFMPGLVRTLDPRGGMLFGMSDAYRLVRSSTGQDTVRIFGRAWAPAPLGDDRRRTAVEEAIRNAGPRWDQVMLRNTLALSDVPTTLPAFDAASVDAEGNVWVRTDADSSHTLFDVFDAEGVFLGPVSVDALLPIYGASAWGPGMRYAALEDENGTPEIRRYRIDRSRR